MPFNRCIGEGLLVFACVLHFLTANGSSIKIYQIKLIKLNRLIDVSVKKDSVCLLVCVYKLFALFDLIQQFSHCHIELKWYHLIDVGNR